MTRSGFLKGLVALAVATQIPLPEESVVEAMSEREYEDLKEKIMAELTEELRRDVFRALWFGECRQPVGQIKGLWMGELRQ